MRTLLPFLFAGLLAGCALTPEQVPVVKTVEVKVPVVVAPELPDALRTCGHTEPGFQFQPILGSEDVAIRKEDQPAFQTWINEKQRCINTLQEWAK